jgi:oxygen-independent coproporphyrinogen-3 oxidase
MSKLEVDLSLVRKYNVPGPRYTSYPPATQFSDQVSVERVEECIRQNNAGARDLSLYFHLPFCASLCWFCGCTSIITTSQRQSAAYIDYLGKEIALLKPRLHPGRKVVQLHLGGGTPTFCGPDQLRRLGEHIQRHFAFAPDIEAGVEMDPRGLTREHLAALRQIGFNRASLGVQDNDPRVQQAVHRIQPLALTAQAVAWIREAGFTSLNVDLIFGLPFQTTASFDKTLDEVLALGPDRFAVFSYAHVPWLKPAQRILKDSLLPTAETKLQLLKLAIEKLTAAGYVYIGMDHFARPTDELAVAQKQRTLQRNFQGYSTRGGADIYAFGMSSISLLSSAYWQNHKELPAYYAALQAGRLPLARGCLLTEDDCLRRAVIMQIMCNLGVDYAAVSGLAGAAFPDYFAKELASLEDLEADGLLRREPERLLVTELGRLFIRNIAMRFDAYLPKPAERRYSRTI